MCTDCLGGADGGERFVRDVECGFRGAAQQSGPGAAGVDNTLDTDDGGNKVFPVAIIEFVSGIEDGDGAAFVTAARLVVRMVRAVSVSAVVAISTIAWCKVGWLLLTWTTRAMLASSATSKCFFGSVLHRV